MSVETRATASYDFLTKCAGAGFPFCSVVYRMVLRRRKLRGAPPNALEARQTKDHAVKGALPMLLSPIILRTFDISDDAGPTRQLAVRRLPRRSQSAPEPAENCKKVTERNTIESSDVVRWLLE